MGKHWIPDGSGGFVEAGSGLGLGMILFVFMGIVTIVSAPLLVIVMILDKVGILAVLGSFFQGAMVLFFLGMVIVGILAALGLFLYFLKSNFSKK